MQNPYVMRGFVSPSASKIAHSIPRRSIIFSEQILSRWLRVEWLRRQCERTYDDLFRLFQSKGKLEVSALELLGRYEIAKATAAIPLSSRIFEQCCSRMNAEWAKIRATLRI
jgi:hypothetical protein